MTVIMMRKIAGSDEVDHNLEKPETHEAGTKGDSTVNRPGGPFQIRGCGALIQAARVNSKKGKNSIMHAVFPDEIHPESGDNTGESGPCEQGENNEFCRGFVTSSG